MQLYFLDLASNALEGTLPDSWSKLSQVIKAVIVHCLSVTLALNFELCILQAAKSILIPSTITEERRDCLSHKQ